MLTSGGLAQRNRLFTVDTRALNYILSHSNEYQKPALARYNLGEVLGEGLLIVEGLLGASIVHFCKLTGYLFLIGEQHRQQVCDRPPYHLITLT